MTVNHMPIKPEIGVEITGLRGRDFVDQAVADETNAALDKYGVVVYRDAHLDDDDLVAFGKLLGEVDSHPYGTVSDSPHPEIFVVSLDPQVSTSAPVLLGTFTWHLDGTTSEFPHRATLLSCREVAADGSGDTEFANTYAAYDALTEEDKALIANLRVVYGYETDELRNTPGVTEEGLEAWAKRPTKERSLVWARDSGRKSMLLGSTACRVVGWPDEDGRALLDRLTGWATEPRFVVRHHWRVGDLVLWDNTGMLHRARRYDASSRRLMHRMAVLGTESVA